MPSPDPILIVDDQPTQTEVMTALLEAMGHRAVSAHSAVEAWELLTTSAPFSLLLLDLRMPDIDGNEFSMALHQRFPDLPVVLVTAFPHEIDESLSHLPLVTKPISADTLASAIARGMVKDGRRH